MRLALAFVAAAALAGAALGQAKPAPAPEQQVAAVLDDWHAAAAAADEKRYFDHLSEDSIFLGTDATERWTKAEFLAYAHPHFAKGRAWTFKPVRRDVVVAKDGAMAWFDEDLATEGLGPCRGSGVLAFDGTRWRIVHYNLALTVPNEVVRDVKALIEGRQKAPGD